MACDFLSVFLTSPFVPKQSLTQASHLVETGRWHSDLVSCQAQQVRLVVGRGGTDPGLGEDRVVPPSLSRSSPTKQLWYRRQWKEHWTRS